ncbi:PLP-dependent aminotransferase family protein [Micromonospora sp. C51]|uniref:MocR-like pyridoxine biosynthesis transcription factor PdxR n=1 Tax=Micromonospora sp. C51 TaxID=2824879 RepID=UPI001B363F46|nr:PLP-dependent aminotransferase family protein [Micromonospora sp. C51]MBQ1052050.1 PLP-dependent aminotransferase family protein [Micromonospora sp. C51]
MELFLDPSDHRSLSRQLYDQIREAIADGRLPPGGRLQPSRAAAKDLGVARSTVTDAYTRLAAEGHIAGRRGGGSVVVGHAFPRPAQAAARTALTPTAQAAAVRRYGTDWQPHSGFDLRAGQVDTRMFPVADWRRSTNRAVTRLARHYGHYGDPAGSIALRGTLTHWLARSRGVAATPESIVVTQGAGHAVDLLARVLLRPGDVAAVEEPGYPPVTNLLRSLGITVVGVPVDDHGLIVDALPATARLVHVTPSHQYPLGVILSRQRRLALLHWASRHGAAVIEDDYDSEFRYTTRPLEPLHRLDRDGRVIYVGTFSKTLSPTLRTGFAVVPPGLVPAITTVRQVVDAGPPPLITEALDVFIEQGHFDRHLRRSRKVYAERHNAIRTALSSLSRSRLTVIPSQVGLHMTLLAPDAPDDDELIERAARRGLRLSSLRLTYQHGEPQAGIVLGFGALNTVDIAQAIRLLDRCLG